MLLDPTLVSAFLMGLLGSAHCVGMCGGIVSACTLGVRAPNRSRAALLLYLGAYNGGRIASYAVAGAIAGFIGTQVFDFLPADAAPGVARLLFAGFTVTLGLYLTGWWRGLAVFERLGARAWVRLQPLGRRLLPIDRPLKAFLGGALWGWLPCGMVYAALAWSLATGDAMKGSLVMLAFGAGTLPSLLAVGMTASWLQDGSRRQTLMKSAGLVLVVVGLYLLLTPLGGADHSHHAHT